ncbi:VC0807 family protein [Sciscionella sediminilitoris]|uniref:VC0807 family protein n=1 Tax=Sciscionella sediminilitoris TaxID=1445613 RepID=UPI0006913FD8|nr:VC0807 family protein [Sciscionella sp. SE31]
MVEAGDERPDRSDRPTGRERAQARTRVLAMILLDVAVPLGLFYGMRLAGVNQWLALILSGALPAIRLLYTAVRRRRLEMLTLFTLSIIGVATVIGLLTADPRLILARESYITALLGLWTLSTLLRRQPLLYAATIKLMPPGDAEQWRRNWTESPLFRKAMRLITTAWGIAFLLDAAARVIMAYTLPIDLVPLLSMLLLVGLLCLVVYLSKAYGRRAGLESPSRTESIG